ncbi:MAG: hypothetical protein OEO79_15395 [Gemmatimonadota bacterium]|nr:hypothetical protein [Gemmatimonadota bacterium]
MTSEPSGRLYPAVGVLWIAFTALSGTTLSAQESTLRPLSAHLQEPQSDPSGSLLYAATRCSALFALISAQRENRGDDATAEMYSDWVIGFGATALRAAVDLGRSSQDAIQQNGEAVDGMKRVLSERMDRNMAFSRSYYADDPLLSGDLRTCRDLVDELRL